MAATPAGDVAAKAIAFARAQIGKPYVWGATGPNSYDCSGLIQTSYKHAGLTLPRVTYQQVKVGKPVSKDALQPGDLIFPNPGHVQLYSGNGMVIEAPQSGIPVREVKVWGFWQARRVTSPTTATTPGAPATDTPASNSNDATNAVGIIGAIEWIMSPHNWLRIGEGIGGGLVLFVALRSARG